ncbi:MAG: hypothetical protein AEth_01065 [Candidatus Argoarchaeum ethanivorans]|uniref:Uncharacterized protein n=1 Tax=Candidatus Argoarchaeum ethanivorans TaxID=2608793 RepID=A0A8B3S3I9_9EURY|nr:MAG: hypothetical protein AEth_01065 [Candidatus Argoarchaeum ethanivorans]
MKPPLIPDLENPKWVIAQFTLKTIGSKRAKKWLLHGFNPCFSGCRSCTSTINNKNLNLLRVSILVLVDVALVQGIRRIKYGIFTWFQSLF